MPATFVETATAADSTTQTFETRFSFTPRNGLMILPGMTGILQGKFRQKATSEGEQQTFPTIPLTSILAEAGQPYTWVVDLESMTVSKRNVEIGPGFGQSATVINGLANGEVIVGAGGAYLFEGAEIRAFEK